MESKWASYVSNLLAQNEVSLEVPLLDLRICRESDILRCRVTRDVNH